MYHVVSHSKETTSNLYAACCEVSKNQERSHNEVKTESNSEVTLIAMKVYSCAYLLACSASARGYLLLLAQCKPLFLHETIGKGVP